MAGTTTSNIKKAIIVLTTLLAIAGSVFFLLHKPKEHGERLAADASEALGQRAAEEVARLAGSKGQIAVLGLKTTADEAATYVELLDVFNKSLQTHHVKVAATKLVSGGLKRIMLGGGFSAEEYRQLAAQVPNASAIVSFVGPPALSIEEFQGLRANGPALVVVDMFGVVKGPALPEMVEAGAVSLAILARSGAEVEKQQPPPPNLFDRYYRILRPRANP